MSFAQKNYPQIQGINGRYKIADIGCFLTSYSNLLTDYGRSVDPLSLNNWFRDTGNFIDVDDGIRDDLGWESITRYDASIIVKRSVNHGTTRTAGWPETNQAIVRFYYQSPKTGQMITHFCKVESASRHLILDSWDGLVKPSPYGEPTGWAEYERIAPLTPVAPTPASYTVVTTYTPGKQVKLNKDPTNLWGMNYHFDYMKDHPVEVHPYGEIITVTNKVHHEDGYDYYRREGQIDGFNVLDCDDYTPPPPKPPAPPVVVAKAETYQLITDLLCFASPIDAAMNTTPTGELKAGSYYVWNRDKNMVNLTSDNMKDQNQWVDPNRNVIPVVEPPKPAPQPMPETKPVSDVSVLPDETWKVTHPLFEDGEPITLTSINTMEIPIKALDGKLPETLPLPAHKELQISHYFVYKGVMYYQDITLHENLRFYALPAGMFPDPYKALDFNRDGDITISDFIDYGMKVGKRVFTSGTAVINTALKSIKTRKFIDGVKSNIQSERVRK